MDLLEHIQNGRLFVVSAPAGTGKTTLVSMLTEEFPGRVERVVTCTTRIPRQGEVSGVDYHFMTVEQFERSIEDGEMLEYVRLYGNYYGTSKNVILQKQAEGKHLILVIDVQGALQVKNKVPSILVFLAPPSLEELHRRLIGRQTETSEAIEERMVWAKTELKACSYYDYRIVNEDLATAYQVLRSIVVAEDHRISGGVQPLEPVFTL